MKRVIFDSLPSLEEYSVTRDITRPTPCITTTNITVPILPKRVQIKPLSQILYVKKEEEDTTDWEMDEKQQQHKSQVSIIPTKFPEFIRLLQLNGNKYGTFEFEQFTQLPKTAITDRLINIELDASNRPHIIERTASLENELLGAAGIWYSDKYNKMIHYPQCKAQQQCIGYTSSEYQTTILRSGMDPLDYEYLINHGQMPKEWEPQLCVLCSRFVMFQIVLLIRFSVFQGRSNDKSMMFKPNPINSFEFIQQITLQRYFNPMDCSNGYSSQHMLTAMDKDVILYPIVLFKPNLLRVYMHTKDFRLEKGEKHYDCLMIDQSEMMWKRGYELIPQIGERVSTFLVSNKEEESPVTFV